MDISDRMEKMEVRANDGLRVRSWSKVWPCSLAFSEHMALRHIRTKVPPTTYTHTYKDTLLGELYSSYCLVYY